MGTYIGQSDIEDVFGTSNVAHWSNLAGGTGADTVRIARAIAVAEEDVENRFRGSEYAIPFAPIPEVVKNWCAVLAGLWLFESRPGFNKTAEEEEGFTTMREKIDSEIDAYRSGQRKLSSNKVSSKQPGAPVVIE